MGLWTSKERGPTTALEKLQYLCSGEIEGKTEKAGKWLLQSQYTKLDGLGSRSEFLNNGGLCTTVALMLSSPHDEVIQQFCIKLLAKADITGDQASLAWGPIVHALKTFPANQTIMTHGCYLCLRASFSMSLNQEVLNTIDTLHTITNTLIEASADEDPVPEKTDGVALAVSGLCTEALRALADRSHMVPKSVELLWYRGLALTAAHLTPQEVTPVLAKLRSTIGNTQTDRTVLLTSLYTLERLYSTRQVQLFHEDIQLLSSVLGDCIDDLPVVLQSLRVIRSFALAPSLPSHPTAILSVVADVLDHNKDVPEVGVLVISLVKQWLTHCWQLLLNCKGVVAKVVCTALESKERDAIVAALDMVDHLLGINRGEMLADFLQEIVSSVANVDVRQFRLVSPRVGTWPAKYRFDDEDAAVLVNAYILYVSDGFLRAGLQNDAGEMEAVAKTIDVITMWVARHRWFVDPQMDSVVEKAIDICEKDDTMPLHRNAARLLLEVLHNNDDLVLPLDRVWKALDTVWRKEQSYWLPDRELLLKLHTAARKCKADKASAGELGPTTMQALYNWMYTPKDPKA